MTNGARHRSRVDCATALEAIYCGQIISGNGEFVPTPEQSDTHHSKKQEIDLDMGNQARDRISREDCELALNEVVHRSMVL